MVLLNLMFVVITIVFIVVDRTLTHPFLQYLTLFYGVFIGSFSIFDIYDDLITRTVEGSDAHACHKLIPCCLPKCVGVQFALIAFAWQVLGVYLALVWMSSSSWVWQWEKHVIVLNYCVRCKKTIVKPNYNDDCVQVYGGADKNQHLQYRSIYNITLFSANHLMYQDSFPFH